MPESSPTPLRDLLDQPTLEHIERRDGRNGKPMGYCQTCRCTWPCKSSRALSEALARLDDAMKHISAIKELTYVNRVEDTNTHFRKILEHAAALAALVGDAS